jgi:hypothetical protein
LFGRWGGFFKGDWFFVNWGLDYPELEGANINVLEIKSVLLAARRWGHLWTGQHVLVHSDNSSTVASINKSTSRSPGMMSVLRELFWCSVYYGFKITAAYLPGKLNVMSDRISRLHELTSANEAFALLFDGLNFPIICNAHMSQISFFDLQSQWRQAWSY